MTTIKRLNSDLPVKLEWLRSFVAVAETGGFTRAARSLRMSQPAVSTHVKELETNLSTRLFESVGGRTRLTRSGESALGEARRILENVRSLQSAVGESEKVVKGPLVLGASTTPGNYLLPPLMARFERKHPAARTGLVLGTTGRIFDRLLSGQVDLGFVGLPPSDPSLEGKPFRTDEIVVFAAADHRLSRRREIAPAELARERFIVREADSATRRLGDAWFQRHGLRPDVMEVGSPETVKRVVSAGLGVGLLSRIALEWEIRDRHLIELKVPGFPFKRELYVVHGKRKHLTPAMTAFLGLL